MKSISKKYSIILAIILVMTSIGIFWGLGSAREKKSDEKLKTGISLLMNGDYKNSILEVEESIKLNKKNKEATEILSLAKMYEEISNSYNTGDTLKTLELLDEIKNMKDYSYVENLVKDLNIKNIPGNDIDNVVKGSEVVFDGNDTIYYYSIGEDVIKSCDKNGVYKETLNLKPKSVDIGYSDLNLYKDELYYYNITDNTIYKYNLKSKQDEVVYHEELLYNSYPAYIKNMRIINNYLYFLVEVGEISYSPFQPKDGVYDVNSINLKTKEKKKVTQVVGSELFFDDDGSIVGGSAERKLVRYDAKNNYERSTHNIEGTPNIQAITDKYIYFRNVINTSQNLVRVDKVTFEGFRILGPYSYRVGWNQVFVSKDILYTFDNMSIKEAEKFYVNYYNLGVMGPVEVKKQKPYGFAIWKVGDKFFYVNDTKGITIDNLP